MKLTEAQREQRKQAIAARWAKPEAREAIRQRMKAVHARAAAAKEPPPAPKEPPEPKFTKAQEQHVEARIKARVRSLRRSLRGAHKPGQGPMSRNIPLTLR
jgi:hypothetical protein